MKIIDRDIEIAPFKLESLEEFYSGTLKIDTPTGERDVKIGGKIDRIDRIDGRLRIIDYKTGSAKLEFASIEDLFDISLKSRNRAGFQTLLYAWLAGRKFSDDNILPGLYVMKDLFTEGFNAAFKIGSGREKMDLISFSDVEDLYISNLSELLLNLFNDKVPFSQTENSDLCKFCDYRQICRKDQID